MKRNNNAANNSSGLDYLRKAFGLHITDAEIMQLVGNGYGGARQGSGARRKGRAKRLWVFLSPAEVEWLAATHGKRLGVALRGIILQGKDKAQNQR